ncbi:sugar ABC transporter ATP-binding protein [Lichenihabitans sp. Uapishka_5]|uniref:sugar ABC transporter ATP-binding protein n=1 Tax=Lichenihabitans sp. Uapishka_5 TaxID=3037302 RepID=UPI0029E7CB55|nr:sugar ABC transporter ATP-binding protein [Lichenihabitans sp. Uapishka_5]MDX7950302.1 sugar ABC transporter ATP-binding protein [Lichenihabitans sp. Uapishka_5]
MTPTIEPPVLRLTDITCSFGPVTAIRSVSLEIKRGEVVGLVGENGAGKSSLLKILSGIVTPDTGRMEINGAVCNFRGPKDAFRAGVGVVHQEQALFTNLTVAENIDQHRSDGGMMSRLGLQSWSRVNRDAQAALDKIGVKLNPRARIRDLSFVDRQMVEIARAVCIDPTVGGTPLIILDEPTAVLEREETAVLEREIRNLKAFASIIFVSHRLDEILRVCDRVVVMRSGQLILNKATAAVSKDELFHAMAGRDAQVVHRSNKRIATDATPALAVRDLCRKGHYRDVSFEAHPGQIVALVGSNRAGCGSLMRGLFGAEAFDSGQIAVGGRNVSGWSISRAVKAGLAYVPAERKVEGMVGGFSAARNIALVHPGQAAVGPFLSPARCDGMAQTWFDRLDVHPNAVSLALGSFSGGNQQKVVMAKWLNSPAMKVFLLDHPLRGLDPGAAQTVNAQIRQSCAAGAAVVLIPDTIEEALEMADTIIVMRDGEISARHDMAEAAALTVETILEAMV